jgi:hypothetical protein
LEPAIHVAEIGTLYEAKGLVILLRVTTTGIAIVSSVGVNVQSIAEAEDKTHSGTLECIADGNATEISDALALGVGELNAKCTVSEDEIDEADNVVDTV